ncbi:MAG: NUDIX domain-containing protein [SAR324 cluster bacterium]|nr:NUDIX domain-containing protein [SAR324 cluster bacterium]
MEFVLAILQVHGRYVMQHRDDNLNIPAPGMWGLFGGKIEPGETPDNALIREIQEELCLILKDYKFLFQINHYNDFWKQTVSYFVYHADITHFWGTHQLCEGQAVDYFAYEQLTHLPIPSVIQNILDQYQNTDYIS